MYTVPRLAQGELLDAMYTLTEGNPFFIEEILKSLIEAGDIFYEQWRLGSQGAWRVAHPTQRADAVGIAPII